MVNKILFAWLCDDGLITIYHSATVLGIRSWIQIRMFLGLPNRDWDPLVKGMDLAPAPEPSFFS